VKEKENANGEGIKTGVVTAFNNFIIFSI